MMDWLGHALHENPELALFLSLAAGYAIGQLRIGSFQLGPVLGTLIAGLAIGQFGIPIPETLKSVFFLMFLFAIGFRTGPEFFQGLRSNAVPQIGLTVLLVATALGLTWALANGLGFDGGIAGGLLAGALTSSTALGTATRATSSLGLDPGHAAELARHVATAYALTYFLGTLLVVWFLPVIGPRLMRVNLRDACRQMEQAMGLRVTDATTAYQEIVVRAYRVPASMAGRTVAELEAVWPGERRVVCERLRRGGSVLDATTETILNADDVVAIAGSPQVLLHESRPLRDEVDDRELLNIPIVSADIVLTSRSLAGHPLETLTREVGARNIFGLRLRRAGREMPFARQTVIERGDVLTVTGLQTEIARVAARVGFAVFPTSATDLMVVGGTMALGGLLGLPTLRLGQVEISLSAPVGVLLAGLMLGQLRLSRPRLGRVPDASLWLFESLGLASFLALVGLSAGPGLITAFKESGVALIAAGALVSIVPHVVTILVGRYVVGMDPGILLGVCAGAGTSAPALAELEKAAQSRIPTLGYGMACAVGNVLLAVSGTVLVLIGSR